MNGSFSASNSSTTLQWQWQTAAYTNTGSNLTNFTQNLNNLGVQVVDGSGGGSYLAGTPVNSISPQPISGGSGGGSSNYTGGHSGTANISF